MKISKVLVANRSEIARRVFRTCEEMGLATVAVFSDPDAGEPHVVEADEAVRLPGAAPTETYLNIPAVLSAAKATNANAIHPGYGFLSENADFARAVLDSGLIWIGPPPEAMELMGSKIRAKKLMSEAGVPTLPSVDLAGLSAVGAAAADIGFPILVKASAGGGGKGMQLVGHPDEVMEAIDTARRVAAGAFGDTALFLEKYLESARHIEIQIFGDTHGNLVSLFERECSIQRRHQKIIEESPSPAIDNKLRIEMGKAAVAAAQAVGYVGAGTVEFLHQDGRFYFLEMNARLQVEHPVTEMVTGLDLVRLQIEVADGDPLSESALNPNLHGHAIEVRLYAEDPLKDFLPVTGTFHRFKFSDQPGLRVDSGIDHGSEVSVHYDPMLAKVIAHAATRGEAASALAAALRSASIHGSTTNLALLVRILESDEFLAGQTDTHFLERNDLAYLSRPLLDETDEMAAAVATALADQADRRANAKVLTTVGTGFRNSPSQAQQATYRGPHGEHSVTYSIEGDVAQIEGLGDIELGACRPDLVEIRVGDSDYQFSVARYGTARYLDSSLGPVRFETVLRFPETARNEVTGSLLAPMPGTVLRVDIKEGDSVEQGQVLFVLEAMKMEHTIKAPHRGVISQVDCQAGDQVKAGLVLVVLSDR